MGAVADVIGGIISGVGGIGTGIANTVLAQKNADRAYDFQRNRMTYAVEDAKNAGLSPLAVLAGGAIPNAPTVSPSVLENPFANLSSDIAQMKNASVGEEKLAMDWTKVNNDKEFHDSLVRQRDTEISQQNKQFYDNLLMQEDKYKAELRQAKDIEAQKDATARYVVAAQIAAEKNLALNEQWFKANMQSKEFQQRVNELRMKLNNDKDIQNMKDKTEAINTLAKIGISLTTLGLK